MTLIFLYEILSLHNAELIVCGYFTCTCIFALIDLIENKDYTSITILNIKDYITILNLIFFKTECLRKCPELKILRIIKTKPNP